MRKPNVKRHLEWRNPLAEFLPRPFLGSEVFPSTPGCADDNKAFEVLKRFYVPDRIGGEEDARKLRNFIRNKDNRAFVIWGDIGIGKSTFLRYQLEDLSNEKPGSFYYGVVDMLRASPVDARDQLERQMTVILQKYFKDAFGGLGKGLRPYAEQRARLNSDEPRQVDAEAALTIETIKNSEGSRRADFLFDALEVAPGPPLFVAIDNLDQAIGENQNIIADIVLRKLRNSKIYVIFALRSSSRILLDESKPLGFIEKGEMHLSAMNLPAMLRPRFEMNIDGECLRDVNFPEPDRHLMFPILLEMFLASDAGQFVVDLAGNNSRKLLDFMSRILYSNQLQSIQNIRSPESCIAALLMLDQPTFDSELSYILNLFDNNEPDSNSPGNVLIRYRVLEFLKAAQPVSASELRFTNHFKSLGYSTHRVREVIATFVGAGLAQTEPPRTADNIREQELAKLGQITLVRSTAAQYERLLRSPWYFISAKNDSYIEDHLIHETEEGERVFDSDFIYFLKAQEDAERRRIEQSKQRFGTLGLPTVPLEPVWIRAKNALEKREKKGAKAGN